MDKGERRLKALIILFVLCCGSLLFARYGLRNALPASDGPLSDMLLHMAPQREFTDRVLDAGGRPGWNPFSGLGNDESTTLWYHPLYPTTQLTRIFGLAAGMNLEIFIHLALALAGMFFYLRTIGLKFYGAIFGGIAFSSSGMLTAYCFAPPLLMSVAYLPALAYLLEKTISEKSIRWAALLGLTAGLHVLEGMVQYTLYFSVLLGAMAVFRIAGNKEEKGRAFVLLMFASMIALLIGAGRIIPWAINLDRMRGGYGEYEFFAQRLLGLRALITSVHPTFFKAAGDLRQLDLRSFVGLLPILMAVFGAIKFRGRALVRFYGLILLFSLVFTVDWPFAKWLWGKWDFYAQMTPTRLWVLGVFAVAVIGAYGIDGLAEKLSLKAVAVIILLACVNGFAVFWLANPAYHLERVYAQTPITKALEGKRGRLMRVGPPYSFIVDDRVYEAKGLMPLGIADLHTLALMPDSNLVAAHEKFFGAPPEGTLMYYRRTRLLPAKTLGPEHDVFLDRHHIRFLLVNGRLPGMSPVAGHGFLNLYDRSNEEYPFRVTGKGEYRLSKPSWSGDFNSVAVQVNSEQGIELEFSQSKREGWSALIDGNPAEISDKHKDSLSMSVRVPPGRHDVVFRFSAPYVRLADGITIFGYLLISVILVTVGFFRRESPD